MQLGQSQSWPAAGQDTGPAPLLHSLDIGNYHLHYLQWYSVYKLVMPSIIIS